MGDAGVSSPQLQNQSVRLYLEPKDKESLQTIFYGLAFFGKAEPLG